MQKTETVRVVNTKNRTYNGVGLGGTVEILAHQVPEYIALGFNLVCEVAEDLADLAKATVKLDRQAIIAELKELGADFKEVGTKTEKLAEILAEAKVAAVNVPGATASTTPEGEALTVGGEGNEGTDPNAPADESPKAE